MVFWCLWFPPKNKRKQVDWRYHSSKVEFFHCFFWGYWRHQKQFQNYLTFRLKKHIVKMQRHKNRNTTSKLISIHYELSSFTSKQSKIAVLATYQSGNSWEWNMGEFKKREKIALVSIFVFISIVVFDSYTYSNQTKLDQIKW